MEWVKNETCNQIELKKVIINKNQGPKIHVLKVIP